ISDVILNVNYTARDGGELLKDVAQTAAINPPQQQPGQKVDFPNQPNLRLFSLKHEFPGEWNRFLNPADTSPNQTMTFTLSMERFPFQFRGKSIQITQLDLFLKFKDIHGPQFDSNDQTPAGDYADNTPLTVYLTPPGNPLPSDPLTGFPVSLPTDDSL